MFKHNDFLVKHQDFSICDPRIAVIGPRRMSCANNLALVIVSGGAGSWSWPPDWMGSAFWSLVGIETDRLLVGGFNPSEKY